MVDIGEDQSQEEYEFEPIPASEPVKEPSPAVEEPVPA